MMTTPWMRKLKLREVKDPTKVTANEVAYGGN